MNGYDRRHFLKSSLLGTSGALLETSAFGPTGTSQAQTPLSQKKFITRKLGKTGIGVPIVSFGVMRAHNPSLVKAALEAGIVLYCQGCEHCVQNCPKGLPIPDIMRAYMYTYGYKQPEMAQSLLRSLDVQDNPCGDCGHCTAVCTKGFNVAEKVANVSRLINVPAEFLS